MISRSQLKTMSRCSSTVQIGERRKERKKGRKLERGNRANREIQSNYRRNTSELENKVLSLVLPFSDVTRLKRSFPRQEISFFFFFLFFDLPLIFTRLIRSMKTSYSCIESFTGDNYDGYTKPRDNNIVILSRIIKGLNRDWASA